MTYIRYLIITAFLILIITAVINYKVDPGGIYKKNIVSVQNFADALVKSNHGLYITDDSFDVRIVSKALSKYSSDVDCVIIGSSRAMQFSSENSILKDVCKTVLNISVYAASIEDHFALTFLALQHGHPNKVILAVDPWTFAFGKVSSWLIYKEDYFQSRYRILGEKNNSSENISDNFVVSRFANLINLEYTLRSFKVMKDVSPKNKLPVIAFAPEINPLIGGIFKIRLKDGSFIESEEDIRIYSKRSIPLGGLAYQTSGKLNQKDAIDAYSSLIIWIKKQKIEPILMLTPYHENVWKLPDSQNAIALKSTEPIVLNMAQEMGIKVLGSYDPKIINCKSNEFFDFMHPKASCLNKITIR